MKHVKFAFLSFLFSTSLFANSYPWIEEVKFETPNYIGVNVRHSTQELAQSTAQEYLLNKAMSLCTKSQQPSLFDGSCHGRNGVNHSLHFCFTGVKCEEIMTSESEIN